MSEQNPSNLYDEFYFATGCGLPYRRDEHWLKFFGRIAEDLVTRLAPRSVLDAGCALGLLVEQLRLLGVEAEGVDISEFAITQAPAEVRPFVRVASVSEPFGRRYDLITCIEVLEHMPPAEAERAIANFCAHSDDIIFSSSPLDFKEATHMNVHPIEHWAELFAHHGFLRDVDFDASFITPWAIRFRRRNEPMPRLVRDYERRFWELWKANTDLRALAIEQRKISANLTELNTELRQQSEAMHAQMHKLITEHQEVHQQLAIQVQHNRDSAQELLQFIEVHHQLGEEFKQTQGYVANLEADLARKIAHIRELEAVIHRLESGRVLRLLRALGR
jgi:SAM-dependent methyltransferase